MGEYECKVDSKGRMRMPSDLLAQLPEGEEGGRQEFVINRGFEKCLIIYPKDAWERIVEEVDNLNIYDKTKRDFIRYFYRGAQRVELDSADRILIKERLLKYAQIDKDVILSALKDRVEVWDKENYERMLEEEPEEFSDLAQEVLGNASPGGNPLP